jgi:hypothetical protein
MIQAGEAAGVENAFVSSNAFKNSYMGRWLMIVKKTVFRNSLPAPQRNEGRYTRMNFKSIKSKNGLIVSFLFIYIRREIYLTG